VWTEWTNCPASPAAIKVIAQGLWWGNGFQGTSLLIPHCFVQNCQSLWFYMQGVQEFHQYTCSFQP
jgi:hypothetical protein